MTVSVKLYHVYSGTPLDGIQPSHKMPPRHFFLLEIMFFSFNLSTALLPWVMFREVAALSVLHRGDTWPSRSDLTSLTKVMDPKSFSWIPRCLQAVWEILSLPPVQGLFSHTLFHFFFGAFDQIVDCQPLCHRLAHQCKPNQQLLTPPTLDYQSKQTLPN